MKVSGLNISTIQDNGEDYISLTDLARYRENLEPRYVIQNWMRTISTV